MERFATDLALATVALMLYGVLGQIFTPTSVIFPSNQINQDTFEQLLGFPIQLFRAVMAGIVAIAMIRVLRALDVENQQRLEAIQQAKLETEQRSLRDLSALNLQLQTANEETARLLHEVQRRDALRGELLQRITAAQEAERQRIARELHDGTGQALTGVAMGLRGMTAQITNDHGLKKRLSDLEMMATTSVGELRQMINNLRPPQLDDMGLVAALRWMLNNFRERNNLQTSLEVQGEPYPMPAEVEITLFRIAQECLTNIVKHAQAQHAAVMLNFGETLALMVHDDGIGFDPAAALNPNGLRTSWGLVGMQERANLINATLTLDSAPGQGTTLTIQLQEAIHAH